MLNRVKQDLVCFCGGGQGGSIIKLFIIQRTLSNNRI